MATDDAQNHLEARKYVVREDAETIRSRTAAVLLTRANLQITLAGNDGSDIPCSVTVQSTGFTESSLDFVEGSTFDRTDLSLAFHITIHLLDSGRVSAQLRPYPNL